MKVDVNSLDDWLWIRCGLRFELFVLRIISGINRGERFKGEDIWVIVMRWIANVSKKKLVHSILKI
jgi:hypothetical protein